MLLMISDLDYLEPNVETRIRPTGGVVVERAEGLNVFDHDRSHGHVCL